MDRLDTMRVFCRIVERGSFNAAARDLGIPSSTATDAIKRLEARLGARLLLRTTRRVSATPDGDAYYRRCLAILDDVEEAESVFTDGGPKGLLRVNLLGTHARSILLPGLADFLATYPQMDLHFSEADNLVEPVREGADCVIRAGGPGEGDLVGRRVALLEEVTVAAPDYLARYGTPSHWDALDGHVAVGFRSSATGGVMPLEFTVDGHRQTVSLPARLSVDGVDTFRAAALRGLGIIQLPIYSVRQDIGEGRLVLLLADTPPEPTPVHILYPRHRQLSLRLRVFIDWVVGRFADL